MRKKWCWVQFACGLLFGFVAGFLSIGPLRTLGAQLLASSVVALAFACLAGKFGDEAWESKVIGRFRR